MLLGLVSFMISPITVTAVAPRCTEFPYVSLLEDIKSRIGNDIDQLWDRQGKNASDKPEYNCTLQPYGLTSKGYTGNPYYLRTISPVDPDPKYAKVVADRIFEWILLGTVKAHASWGCNITLSGREPKVACILVYDNVAITTMGKGDL
ncbi:unnamed protein product [Cylicocyclus nassatus]|uniref:Uncharacterized protein n=1 Tax=Cylicocyclus nassatus TaxID=53992 RepID=A0AA36DP36_CYLNA|nr:unnamed protein product [Cylicocyclus nassatus]